MMSKSLIFIFFFLVQYAYAQNHILPFPSDSAVKVGIKNIDDNELDKAVELLSKVSPLSSSYVDAQYEMALAYYKKEDYKKVIQIITSLQKDEPDLVGPQALLLLANAYDEASEPAEAVKIYDEIIKEYPHYSMGYYDKAVYYIKQKDYAEAVKHLQKSIYYNPLHALSHYNLGLICLQENYLAEGTLSMVTALTLDPTSPYNRAGIEILNKSLTSKPKADTQTLPLHTGENPFMGIEKDMQSMAALNKEYKNGTPFRDNMVNQIHLLLYGIENINTQNGTDYYQEFYIPYYQGVMKENLFPGMMMTMLVGVENATVENIIKKNIKDLERFITWQKDNKYVLLSARNTNIDGSKEKVVYFVENNQLAETGPVKDMKQDGKYYRLTIPGSKILAETHLKEGVLDGSAKIYWDNGKIKETKTFVNDKLEGKLESYNKAQQKQREVNLVDDQENGVEKYFYTGSGSLECLFNYLNGKRQGSQTCNYSNGKKLIEYNTQDGKINGKKMIYYPSGQVKEDALLKEDYYNGAVVKYYENGSIKSKENYKDGKYNGMQEYYFSNKVLESKAVYNEKGNINNRILYYPNGQVMKEENFNASGYREGLQKEYNDTGKLIMQTEYSNGDLLSVLSYNESGDRMLHPFKVKNNQQIKFYSINGDLLSEGVEKKGYPTGKWKYYENGILDAETEYDEKGNTNGKNTSFYADGKVKSQTLYKEDVQEGEYKSYHQNGKLHIIGMNYKNIPIGEWSYYFPDGTLGSKRFYNEYTGDLEKELMYTSTGNKMEEYFYDSDGGWIAYQNHYDKQDKIIFSELVDQKVNIPLPGQLSTVSLTIKNGELNGPYEITRKDGVLISKGNYTANLLDGEKIYNHPWGATEVVSHFLNDKLWGDRKTYNTYGKVMRLRVEADGIDFGNDTGYFPSGNKRYETFNYGDETLGDIIFYGEDGKVLVKRYYQDNLLAAIIYPDKDTVWVKKGTVKINTSYSNGKPAMEQNYIDNLREGKYAYYYQSGTPFFIENYKQGLLEGSQVYYYENGNVENQENYEQGYLQGLTTVYWPSGNKKAEVNYKMGNLHGETKLYDESGNLIKTLTYEMDRVTHIK